MVETLITFVIKRFVLIFMVSLPVGLVSEICASKAGVFVLWAECGLLEGETAFKGLVGIVVWSLVGVAVGHGKG